MIKIKDLNTHYQQYKINLSHEKPKKKEVEVENVGQMTAQYEITKYDDVRNLNKINSYLVTCTQRINIPSKNVFSVKAGGRSTFSEYPGLLSSQILIKGEHLTSCSLVDYFPRTMNTTVMTSESKNSGDSKSYSQQHTTGSSTAETNTFGVSANGGFFGPVPTGGLGFNYQHSTTYSNSLSDSTGNVVDHSDQLSASSSMSIKDWGSYSIIDKNNQTPTWVWGQEYPWDLIQFKNGQPVDDKIKIELPDFVRERLVCDGLILPPTQLSLFGINFVSKATWLITINNKSFDLDKGDITFDHVINYITATHTLSKPTDLQKQAKSVDIVAEVSPVGKGTNSSQPINLNFLGLRHIDSSSLANGATIGFLKEQFQRIPAKGDRFLIASYSNNLLVNGQGFTDVMSTDFSDGVVSMNIYFKIIDSIHDYTLFIKCWNELPSTTCQLTFTINDQALPPISRVVDSLESEGADDNLISVVLRNSDITSRNYSDYLKLGFNKIKVQISPLQKTSTKLFVRALAIGYVARGI